MMPHSEYKQNSNSKLFFILLAGYLRRALNILSASSSTSSDYVVGAPGRSSSILCRPNLKTTPIQIPSPLLPH